MGKRVGKIEPYKSAYVVERSAYRINHDEKIVHLRMLSPDNGKTHVEYYSYIIQRGIDVLTTKIENGLLQEMERKMHEKLGSKMGLIRRRTIDLQRELELIENIRKQLPV